MLHNVPSAINFNYQLHFIKSFKKTFKTFKSFNLIIIMFFNLFKKTKYSNTLQVEECECSHCNQLPHDKMKKCQECGERKVCKTCYKKEKILCKCCAHPYNAWVEKINKSQNQINKQEKYGFSTNKFSTTLL